MTELATPPEDMEKAVAEIERLSKLLEMRDKFIVNSGLWMKFTESIPANPVDVKEG